MLQEAKIVNFPSTAQIHETPRKRDGQIRPYAAQAVFFRLGEGRLQEMPRIARLSAIGPNEKGVDTGSVPRSRLPVHDHAAIARRNLVVPLARPNQPDLRARRAETADHLFARKPEGIRGQCGQRIAVTGL